jgi:hypothetical protein
VPLQKQYGLRVYADKAFDKVNDKWIVPMLRNVRGSDAMIVFVSQNYIESYACFLELLTAVNNRKQIIFVSMGDQLHLGDTTDQPNIERGVKSEILNQGGNIATNTNNTSNDIMRAMKSAYTSLSTLLEQDALSKYDISDAFINFFRDASVNNKTINDLGAVKSTIYSVSSDVFDSSLISESGNTARSGAFQIPVQKSVAASQKLVQKLVSASQKLERDPIPTSEEPVTGTQGPVEESPSISKIPVQEPITESQEPIEEPVTEPQEPTKEPATEPQEPTKEPVTEPQEPAKESATGPQESTGEEGAKAGTERAEVGEPLKETGGNKVETTPKTEATAQKQVSALNQYIGNLKKNPRSLAIAAGVVSILILFTPLALLAMLTSIIGIVLNIRGLKDFEKVPSVTEPQQFITWIRDGLKDPKKSPAILGLGFNVLVLVLLLLIIF